MLTYGVDYNACQHHKTDNIIQQLLRATGFFIKKMRKFKKLPKYWC
jgi:hypothetical protein